MTARIDPVDLAARLVACPSVTPATGAVFDVLEQALTPLGFAVHRFVAANGHEEERQAGGHLLNRQVGREVGAAKADCGGNRVACIDRRSEHRLRLLHPRKPKTIAVPFQIDRHGPDPKAKYET